VTPAVAAILLGSLLVYMGVKGYSVREALLGRKLTPIAGSAGSAGSGSGSAGSGSSGSTPGASGGGSKPQ
jgi:hypothetical protein